MSRFYGSMSNSRGKETTAMGRNDGQYSHLRGWHSGVSVYAGPDDEDRDSFAVNMTHGSNGGGLSVRLGTVVQTPDGPKWDPAHVAPDHVLSPTTRDEFVRTIAAMDPDADDAAETIASLIGWAKSLVKEGAVPAGPGEV